MKKRGNKINNSVRIFLFVLSFLIIFVYTKPIVAHADGNSEETIENVGDGSNVNNTGEESDSENSEENKELSGDDSDLNEKDSEVTDDDSQLNGNNLSDDEDNLDSDKETDMEDADANNENDSELSDDNKEIIAEGDAKENTDGDTKDDSVKESAKVSSRKLGNTGEQQTTVSYDLEYVDDDQVARGIRDLMVQRRTEYTIHLDAGEFAYDTISEKLDKWIKDAKNHSINDDSAIDGFEAGVNYAGGDYLRWTCGGYGASIAYGLSGKVITVSQDYYTDATQEAYVTQRVAEILNELDLDGLSEYEKTKRIYEYVCTHVVYDYTHLEDDSYKLQYTAYAALHDGTSVCQGYSNLLYRLLKCAGIDCRIITGYSGNPVGPHAWNLVKLDGVWYNVDATFDAKTSTHSKYFLKTDESFSDHTRDSEYASVPGSDFYKDHPMATEDNPYELKGVNPKYISVSLGGEIILNYYLEITDDAILNSEDSEVIFVLPGNVQQSVKVSSGKKVTFSSGLVCYVYSCGVTSSEMNENVSAEIVYNGKSSPKANYSVRYYIDRVLANDGESETAKNAATALKNYGAYSQVYFDKNAAEVADIVGEGNVVETSRAALTDYGTIADKFTTPTSSESDGISYYGSSLLLKNKVTLRHYFNRNGLSLEEINARYTFKINNTVCVPVLKGDYVYVQLEDIGARDINTLGTVSVETNNVGVISFSYSPLTYSRIILEGNYNNNLKNLCMALYLYHTSSIDYYNNPGPTYMYGN